MKPEDRILKFLAAHNPDVVLADGFDSCLRGIWITEEGTFVAAYDSDSAVQHIQLTHGISEKLARDYIMYNIIGSNRGPNCPVFL